MNRTIRLRHSFGSSERLRRLLVTGRTFALLSLSSTLFFVVLGLGGMAHERSSATPISTMKGLAASVSSGMFADMLEMEIPNFEASQSGQDAFSGTQTAAFMLRMLTNINMNDPRSLIAGEIPGLAGDEAVLLRGGSGSGPGPRDQQPLPVAGTDTEQPEVNEPEIESPPKVQSGPDPNPETNTDGQATTGNRKVAFIYHSHPRESFHPEVGKDPNSDTKNITLVGKRLSEKLQDLGIGALHSGTDYVTAIPNYRWELSYKYSLETVKEAMTQNEDLTFFFDLHRDSQKRKYTTATINGKDFAQVFFVIGHRNPNWEQNEKFASQIHEALEAEYPGISRGIWGKTASNGNGEYNQSLASESVLIEIGGVDNTLEECYRTADALAKIIAQLYWDAEKVDGSPL